VIPRSAATACAERRLVDRHFAARIVTAEESALRAHLPGCDRCRRYYERHMLYAELVPGRPALAERLGVGLGIGHAPAVPAPRAPERLPPRRIWALGMTAAAACLALVVIGKLARPPAAEFGVRGPAPDGTGTAVEIYRVAGNGSTKLSEGWMAAGDELAFAYRNPVGFARLMVFGVDDRGGIYWFHPAWTDPREDPVAVPIDAGAGPVELPEAIRHPLREGRLRLVALFTNEAISVRSVEEAWRAGRPDPPGSARFETWLEVRP
jgi:hypothetical protein